MIAQGYRKEYEEIHCLTTSNKTRIFTLRTVLYHLIREMIGKNMDGIELRGCSKGLHLVELKVTW
jgi:hypothetical protein